MVFHLVILELPKFRGLLSQASHIQDFVLSLYGDSYFSKVLQLFPHSSHRTKAPKESLSPLIFSSPGPQGVAPYKVDNQKRFSSSFVADVIRTVGIFP